MLPVIQLYLEVEIMFVYLKRLWDFFSPGSNVCKEFVLWGSRKLVLQLRPCCYRLCIEWPVILHVSAEVAVPKCFPHIL